MKEKEIAKDQEAVMRQCTQDIFWYKVSEVPLTVLTVAGVKYVTKNKKFKYGGWPVALGSGVLALGLMEVTTFYAWKKCCVDQISKGKVPQVERKKTELNVTELEKSIYRDCKSESVWKYSFPLMAVSAGMTVAAVRRGLLSPSKLIKSLPSAPKATLGAGLGYVMGQVLYMWSGDCMERYNYHAL